MQHYVKSTTRDPVVVAIMLFLAVSFVSGCAHRGPRTIIADRFDYNVAIGESWKTQTLLNIVKLRYLDYPVFLEVQQVVTGYNWEHTGNLQLSVTESIIGTGERSNSTAAGYTGRYVERPTISYAPVAGEKFIKTLLTPIPPSMVLILLHSGSPADLVFNLLIQSVNGKKNLYLSFESGYPADPAFTRFVALLRRLQRSNALSISAQSMEQKKTSLEISIHADQLSVEDRQELQEIKEILYLSTEIDTYRVVWGSRPTTPDTLVVHTRALGQVMRMLGLYIEIPPDDREHVIPAPLELNWEDDVIEEPPLMRIRSGDSKPEDPYVAVRYQKQWYWIDSTDVASKAVFLFLSTLLSLTESGEGSGPQIVIPAG